MEEIYFGSREMYIDAAVSPIKDLQRSYLKADFLVTGDRQDL